jgi:hypothetical protein
MSTASRPARPDGRSVFADHTGIKSGYVLPTSALSAIKDLTEATEAIRLASLVKRRLPLKKSRWQMSKSFIGEWNE